MFASAKKKIADVGPAPDNEDVFEVSQVDLYMPSEHFIVFRTVLVLPRPITRTQLEACLIHLPTVT
jgi:hypothetical protein